MCGRFTLKGSPEQILRALDSLHGIRFGFPQYFPRYNIAPSAYVAAVLNDGSKTVAPIRWGLIPSWAKDPRIGNRMANARAEGIAEKPSFREPFKHHRCLVLADGFYEWKAVPKGPKQPYYFRLKSGEPFAFVGLWDEWKDADGNPSKTCCLITTTPNALTEKVHDRIPVILRPDQYELWLSQGEPPKEKLLECLKPYPAEEMECWRVSRVVNDPKNDREECIKRDEPPHVGER